MCILITVMRIVILIATNAKDSSQVQQFSHYDDLVFEPILCNAGELSNVIQKITTIELVNLEFHCNRKRMIF